MLALVQFCREHAADLVVMEATGGREQLAVAVLAGEGIGVAVANPRAVRRFAEAMGLLEKTDRIDSMAIAWYAAAKGIVATPPANAAQRKLAAHVTRLRQLIELRTMQTNQRRLVEDADARASIDELLSLVARQIREIEDKILERIQGDPLWASLDAAFRSIGASERPEGKDAPA